MAENWELGSIYSQGISGISGLQELASNITAFVKDLEESVMRDALWAGAEVIKSAMERATPVDTGTARSHVIIYQRKAKTYYKGGVFSVALSHSAYVEGVGTTNLLVGYEKEHAYYMYFVEHGYTPRRKGDIIVRTRAGGRSVTKHFRPEDLFFGRSPSKKHGWTKRHFGRAVAEMEATGGGKKVEAHPLQFNVEATLAAAQRAAEAVLQARLGNRTT